MPTAHFVVPVVFRGYIMLVPNAKDGVVIEKTADREIYHIPESGILKVADPGPFVTWQSSSAEWFDGTKLPRGYDLTGDDANSEGIALWGVATDQHGNVWMYVGPKSEFLPAVNNPLDRVPGKRVARAKSR